MAAAAKNVFGRLALANKKKTEATSASATLEDGIPLVTKGGAKTGDLPADWKETGTDYTQTHIWLRLSVAIIAAFFLCGVISGLASTTARSYAFNVTTGTTQPYQGYNQREWPLDILFGAALIVLYFCYALAYALPQFFNSLVHWMDHNHVHQHRTMLDMLGAVVMYWAIPQMFGMFDTYQLVLMVILGIAGIFARYCCEIINAHTLEASPPSGRPGVAWPIVVGANLFFLAPFVIMSIFAIETMLLEAATVSIRASTITIWLVMAVCVIIKTAVNIILYVKFEDNGTRYHAGYDLGYFFLYSAILLTAYVFCLLEANAGHHVVHKPAIITFGPVVS